MIDISLIRSCQNGDRKSYPVIYNKCIGYVYSTVKRYIDEHETRKDLCQEVFAKIFSKINTFNGDPKLWNAWIRRIAINTSLEYLRSTKKESILLPINETWESDQHYETDYTGITRADIERMLHAMPKGYKIIFMLSVFDEYNHKEIAEELNISESTSRTQLLRAKSWIKKQIIQNKKHKAYGFNG